MNCTMCGAIIPTGQTNCPMCGAPVQAEQPADNAQPVQPQMGYQQPMGQPVQPQMDTSSHSSRWAVIISLEAITQRHLVQESMDILDM